jgi:hypothetical protein
MSRVGAVPVPCVQEVYSSTAAQRKCKSHLEVMCTKIRVCLRLYVLMRNLRFSARLRRLLGGFSPRGIYSGQSGPRTGSSPSNAVFPFKYPFTKVSCWCVNHRRFVILVTESVCKITQKQILIAMSYGIKVL